MSFITKQIQSMRPQVAGLTLGLIAAASSLAALDVRALTVYDNPPDASCTACNTVEQFADTKAVLEGRANSPAGITRYSYWNKTLYAELGLYQTANRAFSSFNSGHFDAEGPKLDSINNPYWRLALTREWGPHKLMIGTTGLVARVYDMGAETADANNLGLLKNIGLDAQSQYLLDTHSITAQVSYLRQSQNYAVNTLSGTAPAYALADGTTVATLVNAADVSNIWRERFTYVYQGKYGGSVAFFNRNASSNTANPGAGYGNFQQITSARVGGNLTNNLGTRGATYELFWTPAQNIRLGAQYTAYNKFNGIDNNYDAYGLSAKDNNTVFGYIWVSY